MLCRIIQQEFQGRPGRPMKRTHALTALVHPQSPLVSVAVQRFSSGRGPSGPSHLQRTAGRRCDSCRPLLYVSSATLRHGLPRRSPWLPPARSRGMSSSCTRARVRCALTRRDGAAVSPPYRGTSGPCIGRTRARTLCPTCSASARLMRRNSMLVQCGSVQMGSSRLRHGGFVSNTSSTPRHSVTAGSVTGRR
jgi:hypothetical protein